MDWNELDWDFGTSGLDSGSEMDFGSAGLGGSYWDNLGMSFPETTYAAPSFNMPVATSPLLGLGGNPYSAPPQQPQPFTPQPGGGGGAPQATMQQSPFNIQNLLGVLGMGAGLAGTLAGGGKGQKITPQMSPQGEAAGTQANQFIQGMTPFAQGQTPLQQQQMSLLSALASGQGLPPGYAQLIEQAFQPQLGDIATQAIRSARNRGFAGGAELLQQGPAGAIAGPALSNLQGQMAQAKLGLMQSLPQLYNAPIQTQGNFAGQQAQAGQNLFRAYPVGQQASQPLGPQIGQAIGQGMVGMGQAMGQQEQQNQLWQYLQGMQRPAMSGMANAPTGFMYS